MFEKLSFVNIRIDEVLISVAELKASYIFDHLLKSTDTLADIEDELEDIQKSYRVKRISF